MRLFKNTQNSKNASEFLSSTKRPLLGVACFGQAPPGCYKAAPTPRRSTDCRRAQTQTTFKYLADTSSGAAADKLVSEISPGNRRQDSFRTYGSLLRSRNPPPHSETPPRGPAIVFLSTGVVSCYSSIYFVFERSPRPRRIFYRTLSDV